MERVISFCSGGVGAQNHFYELRNKELCDDRISNLIETLPLSETLEILKTFFLLNLNGEPFSKQVLSTTVFSQRQSKLWKLFLQKLHVIDVSQNFLNMEEIIQKHGVCQLR
ncbi:hypothetical protein PVAND_010714 [Polypedilum vanderplanki]|uniref:Uncharacterized protein n=1 Tax=Polypedilum vanderplanki TaxID=319348 RepID=A0A9J6CHB6_POLVA|nr:hypothetical protein PVAND_010714 [Polypedilum vanderplanki]